MNNIQFLYLKTLRLGFSIAFAAALRSRAHAMAVSEM